MTCNREKRTPKKERRMCVPIMRLEYTPEEIEFIKEEIENVLQSGHLTMSEKVREFESEFAKFCNVKHAVATNSGTSSLEIALRAIGVERGTVVMPSNTYMATCIAAVQAGAKVVFTECQKENLQIDPLDLKRKIKPDTRAVIIVHIGGIISPHYYEIKEICDQNGIPLIEDAAHAHGATIDNIKAGKLGLAGSFSFFPTKVINTAEGGMLTTDDKEIYRKALILREHGKEDHDFNVHVEFGYNWRFSEIHAVLGLQQMKKVEKILSTRRRLAELYVKRLRGVKGIQLVKIPHNIKSSYYKFIVFLDNKIERTWFKEELKKRFGISLTGEVYSDPCHIQPVFKKYPETIANSPEDKFPITDYVCKHHVCLPLYPGLKEEEIDYIVKSINTLLMK